MCQRAVVEAVDWLAFYWVVLYLSSDYLRALVVLSLFKSSSAGFHDFSLIWFSPGLLWITLTGRYPHLSLKRSYFSMFCLRLSPHFSCFLGLASAAQSLSSCCLSHSNTPTCGPADPQISITSELVRNA